MAVSEKAPSEFRRALGAELNDFADGLEAVLSNLITAMEEMRRDVDDLKRKAYRP